MTGAGRLKRGQTMAHPSEIELLGRLIGFNTVSSRSNLDIVDFIKTYLAGFGVESVIIPDATGTKANLFATLGPADRVGGIVLSGHTDVVPVDDQEWTSDPFAIVERDGMLILKDDERMKLRPDEVVENRLVRFRTLGCYPLTGAIESDADTLEAIVGEMLTARTSERQGRLIDRDEAGSMEKKKREGYF